MAVRMLLGRGGSGLMLSGGAQCIHDSSIKSLRLARNVDELILPMMKNGN